MKHWPVIVIAAAAGFLVSILWNRLAPRSARSVSTDGSIVLAQQPLRMYLGIVLSILPFLALLIRVPKQHEMAASAAFIAVGVGLGVSVLLLALRRFVVSREGIKIVGFSGFSIPWEDVASVESKDNGALQILVFASKGRRKVSVDNTMLGWHELLDVLPKLASNGAIPMVSRALSELTKRKDA